MHIEQDIKVLMWAKKVDKKKEFIGYLKVVFGGLMAIGVSLVAWLYQKYDSLSAFDVFISFILICSISFGIIVVNKKILNAINDLEEM